MSFNEVCGQYGLEGRTSCASFDCRIATPLSMDEFAWSKKQAVLYNNAFFAGLAVIAVATFIVVKFISKV